MYSSKAVGHFLELLNKNFNGLFPALVQPLAHGLFGLVANPIAKSIDENILEKNGLAQL